MKCSTIIFLMFAFFLLTSPTLAAIDPAKRRQLMRRARQTRLYKSNPRAFKSAAALAARLAARCAPNLCFALDGSGSIGVDNYELQKEFVLLVTAIVGADENSTFAATQYGGVNIPISRTEDAVDFIVNLQGSKFQAAPLTFLNAGLLFCTTVLRKFQPEPAKIIILGDGGANFGRERGFLSGRRIADKFRKRSSGNKICAVTVDYVGKPELFVDITGARDQVVGVDGWPKILNVMRTLVREICDRPPVF